METVPFLSLEYQHEQIQESVLAAFQRVYDRNWFILGKEVELFEREFAEYSNVPFCVGVGNGLDALTLALQSCGLSPGDEVIVPAHTYLATWLAISRAQGIPVPVDADPGTFNIDVNQIAEKITARTRIIVPVHMYGQPCNMTLLENLASQFNLSIVEDNAQAHGGMWLDRKTGSFGAANATSFYPTKNLGALGDAGAVTTRYEENVDFIKRHRNYGMRKKDVASDKGYNTRLDEIQAAVLRIKLFYLDEWNSQRRHLAKKYLALLQDIENLTLPLSDKEAYHVYHLFVVQCNKRDELRDHLRRLGIETMIHYPLSPHLQEAYKELGFKQGDFPIAEKIASSGLSLPLWPGMKDSTVEKICAAIRQFFAKS